MELEKAGIIELFKGRRSISEIMKLLKLPGSKRKFVYRTIHRYYDTGIVQGMERSDRPCSIRTPQLKKVVRERICRNPRRSMRKWPWS